MCAKNETSAFFQLICDKSEDKKIQGMLYFTSSLSLGPTQKSMVQELLSMHSQTQC